MQLKKLVELVNLRINGGVLSPDHTVLRADIKAFLPLAVNAGLDKAYNENKAIEGVGDLPSQFYAFFGPVSVENECFPMRFYLDKATVPLKGGYGLKNVMDCHGNFYTPVPDMALPNLKYTFSLTPGMNWYRRVGKDCVEIWTHNDLLNGISYQAICDADLLEDDDEVPIQAGQEPFVIEFLVRHFSGQKGVPYDNASDNKDDVNASR